MLIIFLIPYVIENTFILLKSDLVVRKLLVLAFLVFTISKSRYKKTSPLEEVRDPMYALSSTSQRAYKIEAEIDFRRSSFQKGSLIWVLGYLGFGNLDKNGELGKTKKYTKKLIFGECRGEVGPLIPNILLSRLKYSNGDQL